MEKWEIKSDSREDVARNNEMQQNAKGHEENYWIFVEKIW